MRQGRIFSPSPGPSWPVCGDQHRSSAVRSCFGGDSHVSVTAPDNLREQKWSKRNPRVLRHSSYPLPKLLRLRGFPHHPQGYSSCEAGATRSTTIFQSLRPNHPCDGAGTGSGAHKNQFRQREASPSCLQKETANLQPSPLFAVKLFFSL